MAELDSMNEELRVECSETSSVTRSISIEVDAERVGRAFDAAYRELGKTVRVRGFRPGKVPKNVLRRMYGRQLPEEIERTLVSETLPAAIESAEVSPVSEPDVDAEPPEEGSAFRYTVQVEVKPEIVLPDLGKLTGLRPIVDVKDAEVEAELAQSQERHAQWVEEPAETEAEEGHSLTLDFVGRIDGETFQGGSAEGVDLQLGTATMVPGFEEQLIGVRAGEDRQVDVTFPEDYAQPELVGQDAVFACHVLAVRRRELPQLDDEFAKDLGEFESLEELKVKIREDQENRQSTQSDEALHRSLMDSLLGQCDFDVPPGVVDRQLQNQMQSLMQQFQGRVPEGVIEEQLRRMQEDGRPAAERRVRELLVLEAVAGENEIEISSEDVDGRLEEMAQGQGMDAPQVRAMADEQGWHPAIEAELRDKRVYALLVQEATIEEVDSDLADADSVSAES